MGSKDIALQQGFDLKVLQGDMVLEEDGAQAIRLAMESWPGHWRQRPSLGVGSADVLYLDEDLQQMEALWSSRLKQLGKDDKWQLKI